MHSYRSTKKVETTDAPQIIRELYDKLNVRFFNNELPGIQIFLTPNIKEVVHFEKNAKFVFNRTSEEVGHLNVSATVLGLSPQDMCAAFLHEMCHQYCYLNGIKDTSRQGTYHNKKFRDVAYDHGLLAVKDKANHYGWSETFVSPDLVQWCRINVPERPIDMLYYRTYAPALVPQRATAKLLNPNSHSKKYQCPVCGDSWRATKYVYSMCRNHHAPVDMVLVDDPALEYTA